MIASVRTAAGLGNPPEGYTTNASESLNNVLKRKVNFKRSEWPQFNNVLFDLIREQQEEFVKAVFSQGEYKMIDECQDLQVTHLNWIQMNSAQRKSKIEKAQKAKLHKDSHVFVEPEQSSSMHISKHLSIKLEDARISHVSRDKLKRMWEKAEKLCSGDGLVLPTAGAVGTARQVASLSAFDSGIAGTPHNVTSQVRKVGNEVKCDCPVYCSSPHVCQHALAAADDLGILDAYLQWLRKTKKGLNISQLIADKIPSDAGNKPSARRKGVAKTKKKQSASKICNPSPSSNSTCAQFVVSESTDTVSPTKNSCTPESFASSDNVSSESHSLFSNVANSPFSLNPPAYIAYPPPSNCHPPPSNCYPPPSNCYPPPSNCYPPPSNYYPPPFNAYPPPHNAYHSPYPPPLPILHFRWYHLWVTMHSQVLVHQLVN